MVYAFSCIPPRCWKNKCLKIFWQGPHLKTCTKVSIFRSATIWHWVLFNRGYRKNLKIKIYPPYFEKVFMQIKSSILWLVYHVDNGILPCTQLKLKLMKVGTLSELQHAYSIQTMSHSSCTHTVTKCISANLIFRTGIGMMIKKRDIDVYLLFHFHRPCLKPHPPLPIFPWGDTEACCCWRWSED